MVTQVNKLNILEHIKSHSQLSLYADVMSGILPNNELTSKTKINDSYLPFLKASMIKPYEIKSDNDAFVSLESKVLRFYELKLRDAEEKIILRRNIQDWEKGIHATIVKNKFVTSTNLFSILPNKNTTLNINYLLALLNSTLLCWYIKNNVQGSTTIMLNKKMLEELPIVFISQTRQQPFIQLVDYILFLNSQKLVTLKEQLMPIYFMQIIDGMVYELYFPDILQKYKRNVIEYLGELPDINDMSDLEKMNIIKNVFFNLDDREHKVRTNLFFMDSIPHIRIIERKYENYED